MDRPSLKARSVKSKVADDRGITLIVVLMIMVILLSVIGAGLMFSGINTKIAMNYRTGTKAFNAADIGINTVATLVSNPPNFPANTTSFALGSNLCYRFGYRDGSVPSTTPVIKSTGGFSLRSGEGSNAGGYAFYQYPIAVTGIYSTGACPSLGNETAARVVEAQALYGPAN
jgi:PilX N-terminal